MDEKILMELIHGTMPYGKYKGWPIYRLPEPYLAWYNQKGWPGGRMGILLASLYEIKLNGLEYLLDEIKKRE